MSAEGPKTDFGERLLLAQSGPLFRTLFDFVAFDVGGTARVPGIDSMVTTLFQRTLYEYVRLTDPRSCLELRRGEKARASLSKSSGGRGRPNK